MGFFQKKKKSLNDDFKNLSEFENCSSFFYFSKKINKIIPDF